MIKIFAYVVGENKYRYKPEVGKWGTKESLRRGTERAKEVCSKKVKNIADGKEFLSMNDASKYYKIPISTVSISVKENREVFSRKQNKCYQFILC